MILKKKKSGGGTNIHLCDNVNILNKIFTPDYLIQQYLSPKKNYEFFSIYFQLIEGKYQISLYLKLHYPDHYSFKYYINEKLEFNFEEKNYLIEYVNIFNNYLNKKNNKSEFFCIDFALNEKEQTIYTLDITERQGTGKQSYIFNNKYCKFDKWYTLINWNNNINKIKEKLEQFNNIYLVNFFYLPTAFCHIDEKNNEIISASQFISSNLNDLEKFYLEINN